jgi:hypothetical protein
MVPDWSGICTATSSRAITWIFVFTTLIPVIAKVLSAVG